MHIEACRNKRETSHSFRFIELKGNTGMKALKQALLLQRELASLKDELQESVKPDEPKYSVGTYDHSFQHYVDYKDIGAYESH